MPGTLNTLPAALNDFPVIKHKDHSNGFHTVMCERGANDYVIATWWPELRHTWTWGHYCDGLSAKSDAAMTWIAVSDRNDKR